MLPAGGVHYDDAGAGGGLLVDVVGADAGADDRLQAAIAVEHVGHQLDAAAADRAVEFVESIAEVVAFEAGANFVFKTVGSRQQVEAFLSQVVENDYFGHRGDVRC